MAEIAQIEHRIDKRLRPRIASKRGDPSYFEEVVARLSEFNGVQEVIANPATGSILLHLDGSPDTVLNRARERGLFQFGEARSNLRRRNSATSDAGSSFSPTSAGLLGLGLLQLGRGEIIGPAAEGFWNARIATSFNRPWLAALFFGAGLYQLVTAGFSARQRRCSCTP